MNLPDHLRKPLQEVDFKALAPRPYEEKLAVLKQESEKLRQISTWLDSAKEVPADGWDIFFDYLNRVLMDMTGSGKNCICTSWYELESPLYGVLLRLILNEEHKAKALKKISKGLEDAIHQCSQSAYAYSLIVQKFLGDYRGIKEKWELGEANDLAAKDFITRILAFRTQLFVKQHTEADADAYYLKSIAIYLQGQIYKLWENEPNPAADELVLFEFEAWSPHNSLQVSTYLEQLRDHGKLKAPKVFPGPELLLKQGKQLFAVNRGEGMLLMLTDSFLKSLKYASEHQKQALQSHLKSGANIGNVPGISAASEALEGIGFYTASGKAIAAYLKQQITTDDELAVIASMISNAYYRLIDSQKKDNVVKALCLALCDVKTDTPGQLAIRLLCARWGLIGKEHLPEKYRLKAPSSFPKDAEDIKAWHKLLILKEYFTLNRKAQEKNIPDKWPKELKDIYLAFNGSSEREFAALKDMKELKQDLFDTLENHEDELDEEDLFFDPKKGRLDVRKYLHEDIIPIGTDASGDMFFIDPKSNSLTKQAPVIRFYHDETLTAGVEANSLAEFLGRLFIKRYEEVYGPEPALETLMNQKTGFLKK